MNIDSFVKRIKSLLFSIISLIIAIYSFIFLFQMENKFEYLRKKLKTDMIHSIYFYDKENLLIEKTSIQNQEYHSIYKRNIKIDDIDKSFIKDLLTFEDRSFYSHNGVRYITTLYAFSLYIKNFITQKIFSFLGIQYSFHPRGGSTITQQTVKMLLNNPKRNWKNKIEEIYLALRLEQHLKIKYKSKQKAKRKILELYLNNVYTGYQTRGIISASEILFKNKNLKSLATDKRIFLLSMIHAPGIFYTANTSLKESIINKITYRLMRDHRVFYKPNISFLKKNFIKRYISLIQRDAPAPKSSMIQTWFHYNSFLPPQKIYTTYNQNLTRDLNSIFNLELKKKERTSCEFSGAYILIHIPSNEVISLGESKCSPHNELLSRRQVSSTIKPFIYLTAMDKMGWQPNKIINDSRLTIHLSNSTKYSPRNFYRFPKGDLTLKSALKYSSNTVSLKILNQIGIENFYKTLKTLFHYQRNQSQWERTYFIPVYSLALGTMESNVIDLAWAYTSILNHGKMKPLIWARNNKENENNQYIVPIFSERSSNQMKEMLTGVSGVLGTGRFISEHNALIVKDIGGKSGSNERDSWFVGYTQNTLFVVWIGTNEMKAKSMPSAVTIWYALMKRIVQEYPQKKLTYPKKFSRKYYCRDNGSFDTQNCSRLESSIFEH